MQEKTQIKTSDSKPVKVKCKYLIPYIMIFIMVPFFTFYFGNFFDQVLSLAPFPQFPFNLIFGPLIFTLGLYIGIKSSRAILKVGRGLPWGDFNGETQSVRLVTQGPYAYTRNPTTIGYALLPCGMGLMFQSLSMAIIVPALTLSSTVLWVKIKEEPELEKRFGIEYQNYKKKTAFLIPKPCSLYSYLKNATTKSKTSAR
jgi:protein-S-isoprenylcysteine O-methyltransferase Ste14